MCYHKEVFLSSIQVALDSIQGQAKVGVWGCHHNCDVHILKHKIDVASGLVKNFEAKTVFQDTI